MKIKQTAAPDQTAAELEFGVEIETVIPVSSGLQVGGYHRGLPVESARTGDGEIKVAPTFRGGPWKAERDGSIRVPPRYMACEFISPRLKGPEGVQALIDMVRFIVAIGGRVNDSCGLHVTVGLGWMAGDLKALTEFAYRLGSNAHDNAWSIFAQTGTGRHQNHYCHPLSRPAFESLAKASKAAVELDAETFVRSTGRGMVNFQKLCNWSSPCVEFRAFAATLNEFKILHHLATALGLVSKCKAVKRVCPWKPDAPRLRTQTAVEALERMWHLLRWSVSGTPKEPAYGLFGLAHEQFGEIKQEILKAAQSFDRKWPAPFFTPAATPPPPPAPAAPETAPVAA
jgi:hypothetical protein